jgi:pyridoxal 5'-phosphate synthase pdxT subunit
LLAQEANATKRGGQDLVGGMDIRVRRNHFGRQIESFVASLDLPFLGSTPFPGVFIRAPIVERILSPSTAEQDSAAPALSNTDADVEVTAVRAPAKGPHTNRSPVEIMGRLPGRQDWVAGGPSADLAESKSDNVGDIVAVRQGNVFGTSFHPELTSDVRIHVWWLEQVLDALHSGAHQ